MTHGRVYTAPVTLGDPVCPPVDVVNGAERREQSVHASSVVAALQPTHAARDGGDFRPRCSVPMNRDHVGLWRDERVPDDPVSVFDEQDAPLVYGSGNETFESSMAAAEIVQRIRRPPGVECRVRSRLPRKRSACDRRRSAVDCQCVVRRALAKVIAVVSGDGIAEGARIDEKRTPVCGQIDGERVGV